MLRALTRISISAGFRRPLSSVSEAQNELIVDALQGQDSGIVICRLNRPKAKNSLSKSMLESLLNSLEVIRVSNDSRVMILSSNVPGVFCAGADLKERLTLTETEVKIFVSRLRNLMSSLENLPIPTIAAIEGAALGGGLEMALACDIRVASEKAMMGLVETKLAIIPGAGGTQRLPRLIGIARAKELIFTGRTFNGQKALELGVVNHCVPANSNNDSALLKAVSIAREIIPNGPIGVKMAKQAINRGTEVDISTGCSIEEMCYAQVIPTSDRLEGLKAYGEKRKPVYLGK